MSTSPSHSIQLVADKKGRYPAPTRYGANRRVLNLAEAATEQLGRKMCRACEPQQQGTALSTAFKKTTEPVGDLWLIIADFAEHAVGKAMNFSLPSHAI